MIIGASYPTPAWAAEEAEEASWSSGRKRAREKERLAEREDLGYDEFNKNAATAVAGKLDEIDKAIDAYWDSDDMAGDIVAEGAENHRQADNDTPWYQTLLNDFADKNENYSAKFSKGNIGGGLLNLAGTTLNASQSLYLNAVNAATSLIKGEDLKFIYNMDYHDYANEQKRKFGGNSIFDFTAKLKSQGIVGDVSGNIIEMASELLTDPLFVFPFYQSVAQRSAHALKAAPNLNSGVVNGVGIEDFADDAVSSADDVIKGVGTKDLADDAVSSADDIVKGAGDKTIYSANGDPALRSARRPTFDSMLNDGFEVNGNQYKLNEHAYNSLFKSGRKDIMPADINDALKVKPIPGNPGSVKYVNPITGTKVFVNPETNKIVGIWPEGFRN